VRDLALVFIEFGRLDGMLESLRREGFGESMNVNVVVSPEGMEMHERIEAIIREHPSLFGSGRVVESRCAFEAACEYVELANRLYGGLLFASGTVAEAAPTVINVVGQVNDTCLALLEAQRGKCVFREEADEERLQDIFLRTIMIKTLRLLSMLVSCVRRGEEKQAKSHVAKVKELKDVLGTSRKYREEFRMCLDAFLQFPEIHAVYYPNEKRVIRKDSKQVAQIREANRYNKLAAQTSGSEALLEGWFDGNYGVFTTDILAEMLSLLTFKRGSSDFIHVTRNLVDKYVAFEKEGLEFWIECQQIQMTSKTLTVQVLTGLYLFFEKRYDSRGGKNVFQLLGQVIFMFLFAGDVVGAAIRADVFSNLEKAKKGRLSEEAVLLRAKLQALLGNVDELVRIRREKKEFGSRLREKKHASALHRIKVALQEQAEHARIRAEAKLSVRETISPNVIVAEGESVLHWSGVDDRKEKVVMPQREKVKTRKAVVVVDEPEPPPAADALDNGVTDVPNVHYLSKKALKTFNKITSGEWKVSRHDLFNLFDKLGCSIKIERGKGDHARILLPVVDEIVLEHHSGGIVSVIPELSGEVTTLTSPNWDEKWDGRVPPYMRKCILKALEALRAVEGNVFKSNQQ
jgi:hypothetical protein